MEGVGNSLAFSVCVLVASPFVLVVTVTVPFSNANVVCDVVLSRIVNLLSRRPFLSPENAKRVALECATEMNIEDATPASARRIPLPQISPFKAAPESMRSRPPPPPEGTHLQQTATWPRPAVDPPEVNDMEVDDNGREAARETRRRATRRAQGSVMGVDHAHLLLEFDVVYVWTPVDRVIVKRKTTFWAREGRTSSSRWSCE